MDIGNFVYKTEERKDILRAPLSDGHKSIIYAAIEDKNVAEDVINIIEHTVRSSESDNKFDLIVDALNPLIQSKAKLIVGKLYIYKRRPCKFNNRCKDDNCIFVHDKDKNLQKRKMDDFTIKRTKTFENSKTKEVIFNKVDLNKHTEKDIKEYASKFGNVVHIKKLNDCKWVIVFEDDESAQSLVDSRDPVLDDINIKKYFNIIENLKRFELVNLLEKQESLINQLQSDSVTSELKRNIFKIKSLVKDEAFFNKESKNNYTNNNNTQSLYFNSFLS